MRRIYPRQAAAEYLGMSPRSFDAMVAPYIPHILVGRTGKRYDARDLDAWADSRPKIWPAGAAQPETTCNTANGERAADAGIPLDIRRSLLGHEHRDITLHYSRPGLVRLLEEAERIARPAARLALAVG